MSRIKVAIVGVGNCASSLVQGITYYLDKSRKDINGLMHWTIGGYKPSDIDVVAAFDIDAIAVDTGSSAGAVTLAVAIAAVDAPQLLAGNRAIAIGMASLKKRRDLFPGDQAVTSAVRAFEEPLQLLPVDLTVAVDALVLVALVGRIEFP